MKFDTLNRAPNEDDSEIDFLELETKLSPKLSDLFVHFISAEQPFYKIQELRAFGVDAIALPDICSLSSKGCHFEPLDSLGSVSATYPRSIPIGIPITKMRQTGDPSSEVWNLSSMGDGLGFPLRKPLRIMDIGMKSSMARKNNVANLLRDTNKVNSSPMSGHTFFGVFTTMIMDLQFEITSFFEWIGPKPGDGNLSQPHMKIYMATECNGADTIITQCEMGAIMNVFYNRVYEPGYENHSIFPVLLISEYFWRRVRIIEAVFDRSREKFTVKFTPICHFGRSDDLLWDLFLRYEGSEPRT